MTTNPNGQRPFFTQEQLTANATVTLPKTTRNDVTNAQKLLVAGEFGAIVKRMTCIPNGVLGTATKVMLFRVRPDVSATAAHFINNVLVLAYNTESSSTVASIASFPYDATTPLRLGPGEELWVGSAAAFSAGIEVDAEYENF